MATAFEFHSSWCNPLETEEGPLQGLEFRVLGLGV